MEIWVDVKGYEGLYQVSDFGNVRTVEVIKPHNTNKSFTWVKKSKLMKLTPTVKGYKRACFYKNGIRKMHSVHRLVASHFNEKGDNHTIVNHLDGNKANNHTDNLEWCTPKENSEHALNTGLQKHGEETRFSKLSKKEVLQMIQLKKEGVRNCDLARMFNVNKTTIRDIVTGRSWNRTTNIRTKLGG